MTSIKEKNYKITVVGSGYVGTSLAVLLAQYFDVTVLDIDEDRVNKINQGKSTIDDTVIKTFLLKKNLKLKEKVDKNYGYKNADFVIVATPTDYDTKIGRFDTSSVEIVVSEAISANPESLVVIKSTVQLVSLNHFKKNTLQTK